MTNKSRHRQLIQKKSVSPAEQKRLVNKGEQKWQRLRKNTQTTYTHKGDKGNKELNQTLTRATKREKKKEGK